MKKVIITLIIVTGITLLLILLNTTSPATAGPFGILAIFVLSYILLVSVITFFLHWMSRVIAHLSVVFISRRPLDSIDLKRSYYYSTVIAAAPIMVIGLQSVGSMGLYEAALIFIFVILGCIYVSKRVS